MVTQIQPPWLQPTQLPLLESRISLKTKIRLAQQQLLLTLHSVVQHLLLILDLLCRLLKKT
jgi:hypothetical protein